MSKTDSEPVAVPRDVQIRTILPIACFFLVTLRLFVGWQFFYEGIWKYDSKSTAKPWTAEGYLANAQGPFRHTFRAMVGDPTGLDWLNEKKVSAKWDDYAARVARHYKMTDEQKAELDVLLNGADRYVVAVGKLPPEIARVFDERNRDGKARNIRSIVEYDGRNLLIDGDTPLLPSEIAYLKGRLKLDKVDNLYTRPDPRNPRKLLKGKSPEAVRTPREERNFFIGLEKLEAIQASQLGYKRKLRAAIGGDPDRLGVIGELQTVDGAGVRYIPQMGTIDAERASAENVIIRYGEQQIYRDLLNEYEDLLEERDLQFAEDHAAALIGKVRAKKAEVIGPIEQLNDDFQSDVSAMLTPEQFAAGSLPPAPSSLQSASDMAMWALLILGGLLMAGFCTPIAAVAGAVMLVNFYLVWPPWPGVPDAPGPDHSYIVNKNLIEAVALLAIAAMPTGRWFGLDGLFAWGYRRVTSKGAV